MEAVRRIVIQFGSDLPPKAVPHLILVPGVEQVVPNLGPPVDQNLWLLA